MSNVEARVDTKSAAPIGVRFFAGIAVEQINNPKRGGFIEQPLLLTSGQEPHKDIPTPLGSEPKSPHPIPHTHLKGVRPLEDHDARLFHDIYRGPARLDDEFGRVPSNRTQRRAEARELQKSLQKIGIPHAEARNQSRQAVGLNKPLEDRLKSKRTALFENQKRILTNASAPQVDTRTLDNNPNLPITETTVKANELTAAFEDMVSTQVAPVVKEYFDTLKTPQEQATTAAFLSYIFSLGAANLTPEAQVNLIEAYHTRQAELAWKLFGKGANIPPAKAAGLLLAMGLMASLITACAPEDQTQTTPEAQNTTTGLTESQGNQIETPSYYPPDISLSTATVQGYTNVAPADTDLQPSPTPEMIEIVSLDDTEATPEQQIILADLFTKLTSGETPVISVANAYRGTEKNGALWIEDANPDNPSLNNGYGRTPDDVVKIFADESLEFYIARTSEINDFMVMHGLEPDIVNFNINPDGKLQGVDDKGNPLATRFTFEKDDGTTIAVFIPTNAQIFADGYSYSGIYYSFDPVSGQFLQEPIATPAPEPTPMPAQGEIRVTENNTYEQFNDGQWVEISTEPELISNESGGLVFRTFDPESLHVTEITMLQGEGLKPFAEEFMIEGLKIDTEMSIGWSNLYWQATAQNPANREWLNANGINLEGNTGEQIRTMGAVPLTEDGPKIIMVEQLPGLLGSFESPTRYLWGQEPPQKIKTNPLVSTFTVEDYTTNKGHIRDFVNAIDETSWGTFYDFGFGEDAGYLKVGTFVLPDGSPIIIIGSTTNSTYYRDTTLTASNTPDQNALIVNATLATLVTTPVNYIQEETGNDFPYYNRPLEPRGVEYGIITPDLVWQPNPRGSIIPEHIPGYEELRFPIITNK